jgi:hypothetical protein
MGAAGHKGQEERHGEQQQKSNKTKQKERLKSGCKNC